MTDEQREVIRRAKEAGAFAEIKARWSATKDGSIEEGEVSREVLASVEGLLGERPKACAAAVCEALFIGKPTAIGLTHVQEALDRRRA